VVTQNNTPPTITNASAPATISCLTTMAQLCVHSDAGVTFNWTGPAIVGSATGDCITVSAPGNYNVVATSLFGCTATMSIAVSQNNTAPTVDIVVPATMLMCSSPGNLLTGNVIGTDNTFQWTVSGTGWSLEGNSTTNPVTFTSGASGTTGVFTLVVTNSVSGCSSTATLSLTCSGCNAPVIGGTPSGTTAQNDGEDVSISVFPNPVVTSATIQFTLNKASKEATLEVIDGSFSNVGILFKGMAEQGITYNVPFDGTSYPNGVYYFRIVTDDANYVNKLVLQK